MVHILIVNIAVSNLDHQQKFRFSKERKKHGWNFKSEYLLLKKYLVQNPFYKQKKNCGTEHPCKKGKLPSIHCFMHGGGPW